MTSINNLQGHKVKDGKVVYSEEIEPKIVFAVIEMYEPNYVKENYGGSSKLWLESCITTGREHTWSNGISSLEEVQEYEKVPAINNFRELKKLKTLQGFEVWEHAYGIKNFEDNGINMKSRFIKWIVEVPKKELAQFFTE